ncbi:hypothetical protein MNBD_NITROSPINAE04-702 [hydrothermal vent metagenome]|uniref:Histidine kinase n=1 Tax=hydrothermal vent metagenome TaxID=652676 RepID=A0A3B1CFP5_9ZZZZ
MTKTTILKLLIVDDEDQARRQIRKYIELDFDAVEIVEAANGSEALESADRWRPNVIVSDINMPVMDGLELLRRVKKMIPKTQVIICTGREDHDAPIMALRAGASDYIMKPLNMEELSLAILRAKKQWETEDFLEKNAERLEKLVEKRTARLSAINKKLRAERAIKKELESQYRQSLKMQAIGVLAGGIAHDFNNILSAIIGYTDLTMDRLPEGSRERDNLGEVMKAGRRAKALVKQILTFSRQEDQEKKPVELYLIVKETLKLLRASVPSTIKMKEDIDPDSGSVLADATQMSQVVMNLCSNAEFAMREKGGELIVSLREVDLDNELAKNNPSLADRKLIKFSVTDKGCGIDPATMERIFDPFFTTKKAGDGTGLGLAAVHGIVTSHGGAITVKSKPGLGATFDVYLPKADKPAVDEIKKIFQACKGNERILFVDDERPLVRLGMEALGQFGYDVVGETSSVEALNRFRATPEKFDLVITDQTMPNIAGDELAREMIKIKNNIPVILCTGFSKTITPEKAKNIGIRDFILKPVLANELAVTVRKTLDLSAEKER